MKNKVFSRLITFYFFICMTASGFNWPVEEIRLSAGFGQNVPEGFNTGIHLSGKDEKVYPIAAGEIIFGYEMDQDYTSLPRGLGSQLIIHHEGNVLSVYGHLKRGSTSGLTSPRVTKDQSIGQIGNTGASDGGALFLQIYDAEENILLNPLKKLTPDLLDDEKPVIRNVFISRDNEIRELADKSIIAPGAVSFLIDTFDYRQKPARSANAIAPYKIILNYNGAEVAAVVFESIIERNHQLVLSGSRKTYRETYAGRWLINLGEVTLIEGISRLQFLVIDYGRQAGQEGNRVTRDFSISVADL